jgi:hypothetical protein
VAAKAAQAAAGVQVVVVVAAVAVRAVILVMVGTAGLVVTIAETGTLELPELAVAVAAGLEAVVINRAAAVVASVF